MTKIPCTALSTLSCSELNNNALYTVQYGYVTLGVREVCDQGSNQGITQGSQVYSEVQSSAGLLSVVQHIECNIAQCSTAQYNTVQHNITQCSEVLDCNTGQWRV